jgi:hypothetical protein
MYGNICPPTTKWFGFRAYENALNDSKAVKEAMQEIDERMMEAFARSNFYDICPIMFRYGVTAETVAILMEDDIDDGSVYFEVLPPKEVYVANDSKRQASTVYREFDLTAEQAGEMFDQKKLSLPLQKAIKETPDTLFPFVHVVEKRVKRNKDLRDVSNMPYSGCVFERDGKEALIDTGYNTHPIPVWRWETRGADAYGYGPTTDAMPDIKTLNEAARSTLIAVQKAAEPPGYVPEEMGDEDDVTDEPGVINTYKDPGRLPIFPQRGQGYMQVKDFMATVSERVHDIYRTKYFQMLMQISSSQMTAYEVRERKIERITAMGSIIGRFQSEMLTKIIERVFFIEMSAGRIPAMPQELSGKRLRIDFLGPFAQAQKEIFATQNIMSSLQNGSAVLQIAQETKSLVRWDVVLGEVLRSSGMPEKAIVGDKEYKAIIQAQQKAAQQAQQAAMMEQVAKSAPAFTQAPTDNSIAEQIMRSAG